LMTHLNYSLLQRDSLRYSIGDLYSHSLQPFTFADSLSSIAHLTAILHPPLLAFLLPWLSCLKN